MKEYQVKEVARRLGIAWWDGKEMGMAPVHEWMPGLFPYSVILDHVGGDRYTASLWERGDWSTHMVYRAVGKKGAGLVATSKRTRRPEGYWSQVTQLIIDTLLQAGVTFEVAPAESMFYDEDATGCGILDIKIKTTPGRMVYNTYFSLGYEDGDRLIYDIVTEWEHYRGHKVVVARFERGVAEVTALDSHGAGYTPQELVDALTDLDVTGVYRRDIKPSGKITVRKLTSKSKKYGGKASPKAASPARIVSGEIDF